MKRTAAILILSALLFTFSGCWGGQTQNPEATAMPYLEQRQEYYDVTLYYAQSGEDGILASAQKVKKNEGVSLYVDVMNALLGQDDISRSNFAYSFDSDVVCRSIVQRQNVLYINFSWRLLEMPQTDIFTAIAVLVDTYTQFEGVDFLNISIEGKQLSMPDFPQRPIWLLNRFNNDVSALESQAELLQEQYVTNKILMQERKYALLYFRLPGSQTLLPEVRPVNVIGGDYAGEIVRQLLSGPQDTAETQGDIPLDFQLQGEISFDSGSKTLEVDFLAGADWQKPTSGQWEAMASLATSLSHAVPDMETLTVKIYQQTGQSIEEIYSEDASLAEYGGQVQSRINIYLPDSELSKLEKNTAVVNYMPDEGTYATVAALLAEQLAGRIPAAKPADGEEDYGALINRVYTNNNTVVLDISEKLYKYYSNLSQKEEFLAVYSYVATLCEASGMEKTQFLVDGKRRQYLCQTIDISAPLMNVPALQRSQNNAG